MASIFLLLVALVAAAAIAARTSTPPVRTATRAARPALTAGIERAKLRGPDRVLFEDLGNQSCIGGSMCPDYCEQAGKVCRAKSIYSLKLDRPASISRIEFHAQDQVVLRRQAELVVKLDGRPLGTFAAAPTGAAINVPVARTGRRITIESRDPRGVRRAGEEAVISDVHVFGRELE